MAALAVATPGAPCDISEFGIDGNDACIHFLEQKIQFAAASITQPGR